MKPIEEILGKEQAAELRAEIEDVLHSSDDYIDIYEEVEQIMLDCGLEMDYMDQLMY